MVTKDYMPVSLYHKPLKSAVFGISGTSLTTEERSFFRKTLPFGYILFARNCDTPAQVRKLTSELRDVAERPDVPILIDQEGGRVIRLAPPHWPRFAAARTFGEAYERDPVHGLALARDNGEMIGETLASVGITVNCAPCCDLLLPETTSAIGNRAFSAKPDVVIALARAFAEGMRKAGVIPVIKHMPGHGRARVDSHEQLPVVKADLEELQKTDFAVFRGLADLPAGMSAHVVYTALDSSMPATMSRTVINEAIRGLIGFSGFLFSDDIEMKALAGHMPTIALQTLFAGIDCVLHCSGDLAQMHALADVLPPLSEAAQKSWMEAQAWLAAGKVLKA